MIKKSMSIICLCLICMVGLVSMAIAQSAQSGQTNRQDMLRRSSELNARAQKDTREAVARMHRILEEKRQGQRGIDKNFMEWESSGMKSTGR
jgi:hypothetical protein